MDIFSNYIHPSVYPSIHPSVFLSLCLDIHLQRSLITYPSLIPFVCPYKQIIIIIIIIIIIVEFFTSRLWLGNSHLSWDVVINRIRLGGLICSLKKFLTIEHVPRITDFCSCMYVFGCKLSLVRLCHSDFGITPVDYINIGITCAAFCFHIAHISYYVSYYYYH